MSTAARSASPNCRGSRAVDLAPASLEALCETVGAAAREGVRLEIVGGASKAGAGAPRQARRLAMTGFSGVIDYSPSELVLTAGAGTPLSQIEALLAAQGQMLAFEPFDHGLLYGAPPGRATLGGVIAAGVCGPRRLTAGGARDHLLGFKAVSGAGESFVAGGKVVKNVTGYDLSKLMAGSWGRLAALVEVTLKVLPRPRAQATLVCDGLAPAQALGAMAAAMASSAEVGAAAHLPAGPDGAGRALTAFRLEGFEASVAARKAMLETLLEGVRPLEEEAVAGFWRAVREASPLGARAALWRVNAPASAAASLATALESMGARWLFDWAGALTWAAHEGAPEEIRAAAAAAGGHAMLVRGPEALRAATPMFHPQSPGVEALSQRVRRAFDPNGVFETGRFLDFVHAD